MMSQVSVFLVHALMGLYITILLIRLLLQFAHADFYNPVAQAMINVTQPLVGPLQKIVPRTGRLSLATLMIALAVQILAIILIFLLSDGGLPNPISTVLWSLIGLAAKILDIFFFAIIIIVILSWVAPQSRQPVTLLLLQITEPIMGPVRRTIPSIGSLDISPIFVLLGIQIIEMVIIYPLAQQTLMPRGLIMGL